MKPMSIVILLAALGLLGLACGPASTPATSGTVTHTDTTQTVARPLSDPTAILRSYGPRSQRDHDLDWSTLTGIDSFVSQAFVVYMARGASANGQEHLLLAVLVPETETEGWRPRSAIVGPIETDGPTSLAQTAPDGRAYLGFIGADPPEVVEYKAEDGALQSIEVNTSYGVILLGGTN